MILLVWFALLATSGAVLWTSDDECQMSADKRYFIDRNTPSACDSDNACWDPDATNQRRCFLKATDKCYVLPGDRQPVSEGINFLACISFNGCWDKYASDATLICHQKNDTCMRRPQNCDHVSRTACHYRPGQVCGVGTMTETWRCFYLYGAGPVYPDPGTEITVQRHCCIQRCQPRPGAASGGGGQVTGLSGTGRPASTLTCAEVYPACEDTD